MKHLGDIKNIRGYEVEPVDVVVGGSPCQDLSIAGNREGLSGQRSGLFIEQIRIIKEMREESRRRGRSGKFVQCRFGIWENVPGTFSSNSGSDFQAVLTEFVRVADPEAPDVPMPKKGKWPKSGWLYDEMGRWSVAWTVHDAQYWGVPQRRKRIALVADFNGLAAPAILFDPQYRGESEGTESDETESDPGAGSRPPVPPLNQSMSGDPQQGGPPGEGTAEGAEGSSCQSSCFGETGVGYWQPGVQCLRAEGENRPSRPGNVVCEQSAISFQERAGKPGGGKGILIQGERTGALSTLNNQSVLQAVVRETRPDGKENPDS